MGVFALDRSELERDNATTPNCDDTPGPSDPPSETGGVPRIGFDLADLDLLDDRIPWEIERDAHWSRVRGRHLRRGGTVVWHGDTFELLPPVAGIDGRVVVSRDAP